MTVHYASEPRESRELLLRLVLPDSPLSRESREPWCRAVGIRRIRQAVAKPGESSGARFRGVRRIRRVGSTKQCLPSHLLAGGRHG